MYSSAEAAVNSPGAAGHRRIIRVISVFSSWCRALVRPLLTAALLAAAGPLSAQGFPTEAIAFGDGRVTLGGDVSATFSCASSPNRGTCGEDLGFFNYSDYERSTLRLFRVNVNAAVRANRYVSISPGPDSEPEIPADSTIPASQTTTPVDLDQLFNTLDARTRKGLSEITATARDELYILVWTPSKQIVFSLSQDADAGDFCDQLEITTGRHIRDRNTWPDLELDAEPLTGWDAPEEFRKR